MCTCSVAFNHMSWEAYCANKCISLFTTQNITCTLNIIFYTCKPLYMYTVILLFSLSHEYWLSVSFHFTSDATYVLSFSIIMLNTSLHNPNVKESYKVTDHTHLLLPHMWLPHTIPNNKRTNCWHFEDNTIESTQASSVCHDRSHLLIC